MRTMTELPEAQARLDELVGLSDTNADQSGLRAKLDGSEPVLLHAGVLAHSDVFVWYTLRAYRDPDHITVVVFELELASDSDLPDDLQLVCGRIRVEGCRVVVVVWNTSRHCLLHLSLSFISREGDIVRRRRVFEVNYD